MVKMILDTDIGSDIDDALCLAYLLKQKNCDLLGITTVSGETHKRAMIASSICKKAGRDDIPIFPGLNFSMSEEEHRQPIANHAVKLADYPHETEFAKDQAIDFLRKTIKANPHEITLLAIGPLTNIAVLLASDPEIAGDIKELVIMGGAFDHMADKTEWNILCDPYAAAMVFHAGIPIKCIGLNVTTQIQMDSGEFHAAAKADVLQPVLGYADVWLSHADKITYHDPLAAATIFDDAICKFERGVVTVEIDGKKGLTYFQPQPDGKHFMASTVDKAKFLEEYFGTLDAE